MNCNEAKECYSDYVDCCLGENKGVIDAHLAVCPQCRNEVAHLKKIVSALHCLPEEDCSPNFLVKLNERLDKEEMGWFARLLAPLRDFGAPKALATAATFVLIALAIFFVSNQKGSPIYGTPMMASAENPVIPAASPTTSAPVVASRADTESRYTRNMFIEPAAVSERLSGLLPAPKPENQIPGMVEVGNGTASTAPQKAPYVDKIVILRASNPSVAAEQVRRASRGLQGRYLDYSDNIIFVLVGIDNADAFLQSLESEGNTEVVMGPIDRGLPIELFEVIVIPDR